MKNFKNVVTGLSFLLVMFVSTGVNGQGGKLSGDEVFQSFIKEEINFQKRY